MCHRLLRVAGFIGVRRFIAGKIELSPLNLDRAGREIYYDSIKQDSGKTRLLLCGDSGGVIMLRVGIENPSFIAVNNVDLSEDGRSITRGGNETQIIVGRFIHGPIIDGFR